jgi:two-component system, OmpR family, response regulator
MRVLVVEDDHDLRRLLRKGLQEEGFEILEASSGSDAVRLAEEESPDLAVIDIGLPDADGRDVCQAIRSRGVAAPVLFLTARDAMVDRLSGFSAGGDDYMTKPFELAELMARLRALLRRTGGTAPVVSGELRLDPSTHAVACGERTVPLTPTEFRLLGALVTRPGEIVRRREMALAGWPDGAIVHDNTLDVYVARLRRKLDKLGAGSRISTAHGVGYRLE